MLVYNIECTPVSGVFFLTHPFYTKHEKIKPIRTNFVFVFYTFKEVIKLKRNERN